MRLYSCTCLLTLHFLASMISLRTVLASARASQGLLRAYGRPLTGLQELCWQLSGRPPCCTDATSVRDGSSWVKDHCVQAGAQDAVTGALLFPSWGTLDLSKIATLGWLGDSGDSAYAGLLLTHTLARRTYELFTVQQQHHSNGVYSMKQCMRVHSNVKYSSTCTYSMHSSV